VLRGFALCASLAVMAVACGEAVGSAPDDAGVQQDATADAVSPDASVGHDGSSPDTGDAQDGSDGAPSDGASTDGPSATPPTVTGCTSGSTLVTMTNGNVRLDYDLTAGTATFSYAGSAKIKSFYAGANVPQYVTSNAYPTHACTLSGGQPVITSTGGGLPTMTQTFTSTGGNHFLTRVSLSGTSVTSSWMSPVVTSSPGGVDVGSYGDPRILWIPYDNDAWVRYNAAPMTASGTSFEASAFYDNTSRNGIVVGSVTHDTWKTGVYYQGNGKTLDAMHVFGGATDATWTHDVVPHGSIGGATIDSPLVFVGYAPDWRDLLEEYADANAAVQPRLPWSGGVPFGWNSWGVLKTNVSYDAAVGVSQFIASTLQDASFIDDGVVYVNLDSYWDNLTDAQLASFVATCHANGQKAGIYRAPFADWAGVATRAVEGTTGTTYGELWLRDASNNPIKLDGAWTLDPTHPGTMAQVDFYLAKFKSLGFEYVKLDFLNMGALESTVRYDATVHTGVQAYNQGMAHILASAGGSMFLSASIAPLFPYQYAHARRVSCDAFGAAVGAQMSSEYELESAAYGWWMSGRLYAFNDPDEMVFAGYPANDNVTRLLSAVISGTVFLDGDDLSTAAGQGLAAPLLTKPAINAVARLGKAFRPVEGNTGSASPDIFVLVDGSTSYLAAFNFGTAAETKAIDLSRAGLSATQTYQVTDLWSGATGAASGTLSVQLDTHYGKLLQLR
jgi:hypothetical protein